MKPLGAPASDRPGVLLHEGAPAQEVEGLHAKPDRFAPLQPRASVRAHEGGVLP